APGRGRARRPGPAALGVVEGRGSRGRAPRHGRARPPVVRPPSRRRGRRARAALSDLRRDLGRARARAGRGAPRARDRGHTRGRGVSRGCRSARRSRTRGRRGAAGPPRPPARGPRAAGDDRRPGPGARPRPPRPRCDRGPPRLVPRGRRGPEGCAPRRAAGGIGSRGRPARLPPWRAALRRPRSGAGRRPAGPRAARERPRGAKVTDGAGGPALSVGIPAYNEAKRLPRTLDRVTASLRAQEPSFEILVVDDGSSDATAGCVQARADPRVTVVRNETNRGKGYSVRRGMLLVGGARRLMTDADLSTPIEELARFQAHADEGYDVVIASRALAGANIEVRQPWYRENMGRVFNLLVRLLVLPDLHDTQCGFKLFTARAAEVSFGAAKQDGFSFDVESLFLA